MYVKIKSDNKFYYYSGQGLVKSTTDEKECYPYNLKDKNDTPVINYIISYLFLSKKETTLVPVLETKEML